MFLINNPFPNANVARTVRFTEEMFEELNQVSKQNNISFNYLILQCCRYTLDNIATNETEQK